LEPIITDIPDRSSRRSPSAGTPRLVDVARLAGVSAMTVSRALRDPKIVSPATRSRIAAAVAEIGYVPDLVASSLTSGRIRLVGVIIPTITDSIYAATAAGLSGVLRARGFETLIGDSGYDLDEEERLVAAFLGRRADAIVLSNVAHSEGTRRMLERARIPVVETGNLTASPIDMVVGFSNRDATEQMMRHLIERGHRTVGFVGAHRIGNPQAADRHEAYLESVRKHGLADRPELVVECPSDLDAGAQSLLRIAERNPDVSAVFAASEVRAIGAILECQRRGWPVPERIAIAGFNDAGVGAHLVPALTTVRAPRHEIGTRAAQMILDRIDGRMFDGHVVDVGYEVVVRQSA
jgi:LacI family transcriptional regulator, gluconate utilization system Gnt-I transcriptional repressor